MDKLSDAAETCGRSNSNSNSNKNFENLPRSQQSCRKVPATMINRIYNNHNRRFVTIFLMICTLFSIQSNQARVAAIHINQQQQHELELSHSNLHLQLHHKSPRYNQQASVSSTLIRPIECRNANNQSELGICMFSIDCMHNKGVALSVCKHNYFVGTCCRLPDHNNFVGIVYDLRDTDYGFLLEARKVSQSPETNNSGDQDLAAASKVSTTVPAARKQTVILRENDARVSEREAIATSSAPSDFGAPTLRDISLVSPIKSDEKYVISSNSLFTSNSTVQHGPATDVPSSPQNIGITRTTQPALSTVNTFRSSAENLELTSNAESTSLQQASPQQPHEPSYMLVQKKQQQQLSSIKSDSVQQESFDVANTNQITDNQLQASSSEPAAAVLLESSLDLSLNKSLFANSGLINNATSYDVIASASTTTTNASSSELEVLANMSSAHSASSKSPSIQHLQPEDNHTTSHDDTHLTTVAADATSSISPSSSAPPSQLMSLISTMPATINDSATSTQEFTIASSPQQPLASLGATTDLVDLVSSSQASEKIEPNFYKLQVRTTTPFTTSLSTAQIPNLTSQHLQYSSSLAPSTSFSSTPSSSQSFDEAKITQAAGSTGPDLLPSGEQITSITQQQQNTSTQQAIKHNDNSNTPTSSSISTSQPNQQFWVSSVATTSQQAHTQKPSGYHYPNGGGGGGASPFGYGQLYSSHHSSHAPSSLHKGAASNVLNGANYHQYQQAGGLVASTKTVSPIQPGNNLIPNLSHLQSAILSHIPFKLASGLSSGLTSYLTAAMKPNGGRPLLSSNTAVAHQFGQSNNTNKQATSSTIRFPSSTSSTTTTSTTSQTEQHSGLTQAPTAGNATSANQTNATTPQPPSTSNNSSATTGQLMGWPLQSLITASASHFGMGTTSALSSRDAALQVCGRPQVGPAALGPYSSSQAAALAISSNAEAKKRVARIVGGNQSAFGQWPWIVSLRQWRKGAFLHKCGAALLNDQWAITAAHCVENVKPSDLLLRLGEFDVSNQNEPYPYVERRVKTIVAHPLFDSKTFEYDLALLRFAEPIRYERNILPVCVPSGNDSYVDRIATVIGWGRLYEDGPLPDIIQHVDVPIITNQECEHMYKKAGFVEEIPDIFICAGITKGGRDSCEGDSGGPLTMVDNDGRAYLVGIISWGIGCALPSQPGVYTRITTFSGWINDIVNT